MDNNQTENQNQNLTKEEKFELRQEQKITEEKRIARKIIIKKVRKIIITVLVAGPIVWGFWYASTLPVTKRTNRQVALSCTTDMATQFHIHPNLKIMINGQRAETPANIGVRLNCMNPIHTHDATGILHVESPEVRDFTLSDFFAVWGKTFSQNQILDSVVDDSHIIVVTVNGKPVDTYENTILRDKDEIVVSYEDKK